ncbi:UNVERIFIED_CONTAM: hypothetical protein HHA_452650 [Hammondia hammondi]|eukprot:XP_008885827.1 hypothetical protein HHA_452650 [Hammondia hammondi]
MAGPFSTSTHSQQNCPAARNIGDDSATSSCVKEATIVKERSSVTGAKEHRRAPAGLRTME